MESPTKRCSTCKQKLPVTEFYRARKSPDGLQCLCRTCTYASQKRYYARSQQSPLEVKYCSDCKQTLPSAEFHKNRLGVGGLQTSCKVCQRTRRRIWEREHRDRARKTSRKHYWESSGRDRSLYRSRKKHTGIEREQYDFLMELQGGRCAICNKPPLRNALYVDHCHTCDKIRSLLCVNCNKAIDVKPRGLSPSGDSGRGFRY
jgi:hypothetical protein